MGTEKLKFLLRDKQNYISTNLKLATKKNERKNLSFVCTYIHLEHDILLELSSWEATFYLKQVFFVHREEKKVNENEEYSSPDHLIYVKNI